VGLRLFDTREEAAWSHIEGVRRLLGLKLADKLNYLARNHGLKKENLITWHARDKAASLVADLAWSSMCIAAGAVSGVREQAALEDLCARVRSGIGQACIELSRCLSEALSAYGRIRSQLDGELASKWPEVSDDIESQMSDMFYPGFLLDLEPGRLRHYPRYLKAVEERLRQLRQDPSRDRSRMHLVAPWWQRYIDLLEAGRVYDETLDSYRWLLEEYRVSLFAQQLGTAEKVSDKRLEEAWSKVIDER
jgi:ATP-dependent helicase HrpA